MERVDEKMGAAGEAAAAAAAAERPASVQRRGHANGGRARERGEDMRTAERTERA
jgi:hypothetical protein